MLTNANQIVATLVMSTLTLSVIAIAVEVSVSLEMAAVLPPRRSQAQGVKQVTGCDSQQWASSTHRLFLQGHHQIFVPLSAYPPAV
jgi:hypothetical protein